MLELGFFLVSAAFVALMDIQLAAGTGHGCLPRVPRENGVKVSVANNKSKASGARRSLPHRRLGALLPYGGTIEGGPAGHSSLTIEAFPIGRPHPSPHSADEEVMK
jgi:hypothetical protein